VIKIDIILRIENSLQHSAGSFKPLAFIVLVVTIITGLLHTPRRHHTRSESGDSNWPLAPQVPRSCYSAKSVNVSAFSIDKIETTLMLW